MSVDREHMRLLLVTRKSNKVNGGGGEAITFATQTQRCREWAAGAGHTVVDVVADTKSGVVAPWDRPNLRAWVTDPEKMSLYDGVLVYRGDRLTRGDWDQETRIRQWAGEHSKVLCIVDGPQWPPRHDGDFWAWTAQAKQSRDEWEAIRERSMRAQGELRSRGKLVGRPGWGYQSSGDKYDHKLVPTDSGRKYIPRIFELCIEGWSSASIAEWLENEGVKTTSGTPWWPRTINTMIKNPLYTGRRMDSSGTIIHTCEPLVDAWTFERANKALRDANRGRRGPRDRAGCAMLAPTCPQCGAPMHRIQTQDQRVGEIDGQRAMVKTGHVRRYYRCYGVGAQRKGCGNMVSLASVDALVGKFLAQFDTPIYRREVVLGVDHAAEIAEISLDLKGLPALALSEGWTEEKEDARRSELRAEKRRLLALPTTPDTVALLPTGKTYGQEWSALSTADRRAWLRSRGIVVYAARTDRGVIEAAWPDLQLKAQGAATLLEAEGVSVVVTWAGAGIDDAVAVVDHDEVVV